MFSTTKILRIQFSFQFLLLSTIQCIWFSISIYRKSIIYMFGSRLRILLPQLIPCYSLIFHILTTYAATLIDVYSTTHENDLDFYFVFTLLLFSADWDQLKWYCSLFFIFIVERSTWKKIRFFLNGFSFCRWSTLLWINFWWIQAFFVFLTMPKCKMNRMSFMVFKWTYN